MGRVTVHNYMFPIQFTYKGWEVEISDETGFFSMKDIKVKAKIEIPAESYADFIATQYAKTKSMTTEVNNKNRLHYSYFEQIEIRQEEYKRIYQEAYNHYFKLAKEYAKKRSVIQKTFGVNGGLIDRFLGQNISATEKAQQLVINYIDNNLGDAWNDFIKSIDDMQNK